MLDAPKIVLEPNSHGGLLIWEMPKDGSSYVVASDTAAGLSKGDYAAAMVLEAETGDLVARWKERQDPHKWGPACALLGWFYNEAILAFETGASSHGQTADTEARNSGYSNMFVNVKTDRIRRTQTETRGWVTNVATKGPMINAVKKALEADFFIPDEELLHELRDQQWCVDERGEGTGKMGGAKHDDLVMTYAVALCVRELCWRRGQLKTEDVKPSTVDEIFWAAEDRRNAALERNRKRPKPMRLRCG